jgi:hypothetical protein
VVQYISVRVSELFLFFQILFGCISTAYAIRIGYVSNAYPRSGVSMLHRAVVRNTRGIDRDDEVSPTKSEELL